MLALAAGFSVGSAALAQTAAVLPTDAQAALPLVDRPTFHLTPAVDARVVATDNAGPDASGQVHGDLVVEVQPSISFEKRGPQATLSGTVSVSELSYTKGTHERRTLTRARVDLASRPIEGLLYFDAWARIDPTFEDPFAAQPDAATAYKLESRRRYGLSPYILKRFGDDATVLVRSDYISSRVTDAVTSERMTTVSKDQVASVEHIPRPFGILVEARSRSETSSLQDEAVLKDDSSRLWLSYAFDQQVIVSVDGGRERVVSSTATVLDSFYGGRIQLRPTERTDLSMKLERRFFGTGWDAYFTHRAPTLSVRLQSSRIISSQDVPAFAFAAGENIANGLNNMLTTSISDPVLRQQEVDKIIATRNLPTDAANALTLYASVPQLRQSSSLEFDLRGRRNLVFLQFGYLKTQVLQSLGLANNNADVLQKSVSLGWNMQITPTTTFNLLAEVHNAVRLAGPAEGNYSQQRAGRGEVVFSVSPKSFLTFGARKSVVRSNFLNAADSAGEVAAYAGLRHRF